MKRNTGIPSDQHKLVLSEIFPSGAQEYYCPTCGRRFIVQFPPNYTRIMLELGDEMAIHTGGTPQPDAGSCSPSGDQTGAPDDPYLRLWADFLDNINL